MALLFSGAMAAPAMAVNCIWNPATGNWSTGSDWSCSIVPGINDDATIAVGKAVTIDSTQSIRNLSNAGDVNIDAFLLTLSGAGGTTNTGTIHVGGPITAALQVSAGHNVNNAGGLIDIANGSVVNQFGSTITGGTIGTTGTGALVAFNSAINYLSGVTLNGTLDMASGTGRERVINGLTLNGAVNVDSNSILSFEGTQAVGGTGAIAFGSSGSNRLDLDGTGTTTFGSGITIRGQNGTIGQQINLGGTQTLQNDGLISADVAGGTITITQSAVGNNNVMEARNGGTLSLQSDVTNSGSGVILADNGVVLLSAQRVTGGAIDSANGGVIRATNSAGNYLDATTLNGTLDLASATGRERVVNGLTLDGTVNIDNNSIFSFEDTQAVGGSGSINFGASVSNRLGLDGTGTTTIGPGITIRGQNGTIGQQINIGGTQILQNDGLISADVAGGTITITESAVTNNGTLEATNGGTLILSSDVTGGVGSQILAGAGSTVLQNGVTISGVVNTSGTGSFRASGSSGNFLNNVSLSGTLDLLSATSIERVTAGLTMNNATVNIGANSIFAPQGNQTIGGTGTIVFSDASASNRFNVENGNLTLGSGITVRGGNGVIGNQNFIGGAATLTNDGTIQADVAGRSISIGVSGTTTNNGTLAALNGGTLNLNSNVVGNTGSEILAGAGSVVTQNGITISGDMNLTGAGSFRPSNNGNNFLSGVTLSGTLDLASAAGIERVSGGMTLNNATVNIGANSIFAPQGNQTIGGTGTIVFSDASASNRFNVENGNLTLGSGVTLRGGNGVIGNQSFIGGAATLTNQGLIAADANGRSITLAVNGTTFNEGTMKAQDGGTLNINSGVDNSAGTLLADNGGVVVQNGTTITGGALNSVGTGVFMAANNNNNVMNGVTLNGVLDMASATGVERITAGGMVLNGTINIGNSSTLAPQGDQTISGTGNIVFADGSNNRLNVEAGNLVIGSGVTIRGQTGVIGQQVFVGGTANLANNGTINADAGGTITVNVTGALTNDGTMRAQNGTLTIQDQLGGTGTLQVDSGGVMNLANSPNTQGQLVMGSAGSTLNIGTQNLTINNDYTNVAAGAGNSFNRRAGVSGAGSILSGGDAAQAITGAGVSNGNTANATLTLGNVRVGATTFDYQIANTGTTGPSLRGAIQTNVNGGNLTDGRLSGAGVAAGNYNTGAPGSDTGNLGVTFTAASAGVLAPLSGQVLNLRSNFDDIADQKLNIVLGAGAAAFNAAVGSTTPSPVVLGNQRIGGALSQQLTVSNTAPAGAFSEDLNGSFGANTGSVTNNGGGINGLLAGASNSAAMSVGVNTASAGAKIGTVTLDYETAGAVNGVSNGLGTAGVGSQVIDVSGDVFQVAQPAFDSTNVNLGNVRVGGTAQQALGLSNTNIAPGFQEGLKASIGGATAGITAGGNFANLAAGGTDNTSLLVGLDTTASGAKNGTASVDLTSTGAGTSGLTDLSLGSQVINVSGNVYQVAAGQINTAPLNFGTVQVGQLVQQTLSVSNTATGAAGFVEDLNASFGATSGSNGNLISGVGAINGLLAGGTNASNMVVNVNTGAAATVNGAIAVNFVSAGAVNGVSNGLGTLALGSVDYGVSGVIQLGGLVIDQAVPVINNSPIDLGNVRVGAVSPVGFVSVTNQATGNDQAALNASISGNAPITAAGSFNLLDPGLTDTTNLQVGMNTAAAGAINGTATIAFVSDASNVGGCAPNCQLNLASQTVNVSGNVYQVAQPNIPGSVNLGNVRIGDSRSQAITIGNTDVAPGFQEGLNASVTGTSNATSAGGPITNLAAGSTSNAISVGMTAATAGNTNNGTVTLGLETNGAGTSGLGTLALADATVDVSATGYRLANPTLNTPSVTLAARVGDALPTANVSVTNTSPDAFTEGLKADFGTASAGFTATGNVGNLAAGGTDGSSLDVGLASTAVSQNISGTVDVEFQSTGAGTTGAADISVGSQLVNLAGKVYQQAVALVQNAVDFGIVHVGELVAGRNVQVQNTAPVAALNDTLTGGIGGVGGPFSASGSLAGVAAGGTDSASLNVGLDTSTAGIFSGNAVVGLASHNPDMAELILSDASVLLSAQVNNYANADLNKTGGAGSFGMSGLVYTLDFGDVLLGSSVSALLEVLNDVAGPSDLLDGSFSFLDPQDFLLTGFGPFADLNAGQRFGGLGVGFDALTLGGFGDDILLATLGHNSSGYSGGLNDITLRIRANVVSSQSVSEPGTLALMGIALAGLLGLRRRLAPTVAHG